jgi:hypothetical protein
MAYTASPRFDCNTGTGFAGLGVCGCVMPFKAALTVAGYHGQPCPHQPDLFGAVGVELNQSELEHCTGP